MDELRALKKLQKRSENALKWFIDRYSAYVNTIICNVTGSALSAADIEEISSDVFFTLWTNAERIAPGKAKAYLGSVARNKAKERLKRAGAWLPLEDVILISGENTERDFEKQEQAAFLRKAIAAMDDSEREIFVRHYYYYQQVAVIAEEMGLNVSTVKTRLHRGRKKLKNVLEEGGWRVEN